MLIETIVESKICTKCGKEKPLAAFYLTRNSPCSSCKTCMKAATRAYRIANRARVVDYRRQHYHKNREAILACRREGKPQILSQCHNWKLAGKSGIRIATYNEMLFSQDGRCAICGQPETAVQHGKIKALAVDHKHKTGQIRGLLCQRCNMLLGFAGDNTKILEAVVVYLCRQWSDSFDADAGPAFDKLAAPQNYEEFSYEKKRYLKRSSGLGKLLLTCSLL